MIKGQAWVGLPAPGWEPGGVALRRLQALQSAPGYSLAREGLSVVSLRQGSALLFPAEALPGKKMAGGSEGPRTFTTVSWVSPSLG